MMDFSTPAFVRAFNWVVSPGVEGEFSDDPNDKGNWTSGKVGEGELVGTKWGISAAAYPAIDIRGLRLEKAKEIYWRDYWHVVRGDSLPPRLAMVVFDCAVNQGTHVAAKLLQTAVGCDADGIVGPLTLAKVREHEQDDLIVMFQALRALRYTKASDFSKFGKGWMRRLFNGCMEASR